MYWDALCEIQATFSTKVHKKSIYKRGYKTVFLKKQVSSSLLHLAHCNTNHILETSENLVLRCHYLTEVLQNINFIRRKLKRSTLSNNTKNHFLINDKNHDVKRWSNTSAKRIVFVSGKWWDPVIIGLFKWTAAFSTARPKWQDRKNPVFSFERKTT